MKNNIIVTVIIVTTFLLGFFIVFDFNTESNSNFDYYSNMDEGEHLRFVFLGSSSCTFSNREEVIDIIKQLNEELRGLSGIFGMKYLSTGISADIDASLGVSYLAKTGDYDEIISGSSWYNTGLYNFIWDPDIGYASTPQVLVFKTKFDVLSNDFNIFKIDHDNYLLQRYIGVEEIEEFHRIVTTSDINTIADNLNLELPKAYD